MKNQTLKNSLTVISIAVCACLFLTETVKAQITYRDVNKQQTSPISSKIITPYDSTLLRIEKIELEIDYKKNAEQVDYYKKYIGQQFYLLKNSIKQPYIEAELPKTILFTEKKTTNKLPRTKTDVYCPICKKTWDYSIGCYNDKSKVENKYYDIIDVVSVNFRVRFILKETISGDIVYTINPEYFILTGAVVKAQQISVGKTFIEIEWERNQELSENFPKLKNNWKCKDVTFVDENGDWNLVYVLQNTENASKEVFKHYPLKTKSYYDLRKSRNEHFDTWVSEGTFNKYINYKDSLLRDREEKKLIAKQEEERQRFLEQQKKEEEKKISEGEKRVEEERLQQEKLRFAELDKQREAAKEQRRQVLITKYGQTIATKILNQEPEIGMTKAMFDDMNVKPWIVSNQKMETANGIAEVYVVRYSLYKCKRIVIINEKIKQIDTYNCN